ncbi:MAG: universal stress protein [Verrucomicrobia bacterium]|nr:universal stress protein [Verrucomicrobiota bacterium]
MKTMNENRIARPAPHGSPRRRQRPHAILKEPESSEDRHLKFGKLLVPVDFTPTTLRALRYAASIADQFGSRLYALHVVELGVFFNDLDARLVFAKSADEVAAESVEQLRQLVRRELPKHLPVTPLARCGQPAREIVRAAGELGCDLIILAAYKHSTVRRALLGSTASRVEHEAPCPVLVIPVVGAWQYEPTLWRDANERSEPEPMATPARLHYGYSRLAA